MNGVSSLGPDVDKRKGDAYSDRMVFKELWCTLDTDVVCQADVVFVALFTIVVLDETLVD